MDNLTKESIVKSLSSSQWEQIFSLVDYARDCWHLLPDNVSSFCDLSSLDAYSLGFTKAVLHLMSILGIDESNVKE